MHENILFITIEKSKGVRINNCEYTLFDRFVDTDFSAQVFTNCEMVNNTQLSLSGPCPTLDLDYNIYIEEALHGHLVAQLAFVPAAALAGIALTVLQRPKMIGFSLFLSSVAALCLMLVNVNSSAVLGFEGGFMAVFAVAWTSLTLVTIESFPTHLRYTKFTTQNLDPEIHSPKVKLQNLHFAIYTQKFTPQHSHPKIHTQKCTPQHWVEWEVR